MTSNACHILEIWLPMVPQTYGSRTRYPASYCGDAVKSSPTCDLEAASFPASFKAARAAPDSSWYIATGLNQHAAVSKGLEGAQMCLSVSMIEKLYLVPELTSQTGQGASAHLL